jgi:hypothetical protein
MKINGSDHKLKKVAAISLEIEVEMTPWGNSSIKNSWVGMKLQLHMIEANEVSNKRALQRELMEGM